MKRLKTIILLGMPLLFLSLYSLAAQNKAAEQTRAKYEYASFSSMGNNSSIIWPDGSVLKLSDSHKRPSAANEKMYYMTIALNIFEEKGFSLFSSDTTPNYALSPNVGHENDLVFRRQRLE